MERGKRNEGGGKVKKKERDKKVSETRKTERAGGIMNRSDGEKM